MKDMLTEDTPYFQNSISLNYDASHVSANIPFESTELFPLNSMLHSPLGLFFN